ncbi:hypothetical protein PGTUg99_029856 [Puccinia graminis f. sp. tritici]|uniref:Uncharacterized protein n=1 Tax=Puccinia graminis f. sp. tritici TaxID=56615 RepID=A0A5B0PMI0_PUCGR|nr:hypothetical protein PGTUg99_029856 [Puccinia graminis f. sp. tritici]
MTPKTLNPPKEIEMAPLHPDIRADADIRLPFQGEATSAPATATAGGYPPA